MFSPTSLPVPQIIRMVLTTLLVSIVLAGTARPGVAAGDALLVVRVAGQPDVAFDRAGLEALPQAEIMTATPWNETASLYRGPTLASVLEHLGVSGQTVRARALNDYAVDVPLEEAVRYGAILALQADGHYLRVRDKGPLFLMFPFDQRDELKTEVWYSRAIWQLHAIDVR